MPVDIVGQNNAMYEVWNAERLVSQHTTDRKAFESAVNEAQKCKCEVQILRNLKIIINHRDGIIVSFEIPTTRKDGQPLNEDEICCFNIYARLSGEDAFDKISISEVSKLIVYLDPGVYDFAVTTVDVDGVESEMSKVITQRVR